MSSINLNKINRLKKKLSLLSVKDSFVSSDTLESRTSHVQQAKRLIQIVEQAIKKLDQEDIAWEKSFNVWRNDWRQKLDEISFENVLQKMGDKIDGDTPEFNIHGMSSFEFSDFTDDTELLDFFDQIPVLSTTSLKHDGKSSSIIISQGDDSIYSS